MKEQAPTYHVARIATARLKSQSKRAQVDRARVIAKERSLPTRCLGATKRIASALDRQHGSTNSHALISKDVGGLASASESYRLAAVHRIGVMIVERWALARCNRRVLADGWITRTRIVILVSVRMPVMI